MVELSESPTKRQSPYSSPTFDRDVSILVDEPVGAASISPSGRDVVLASRDGLYIIDLDSPWSPPRHLPHRSPWEVADVQWSPFASRDHWVISTSNQKALVWNLESSNPIEHVLHAHLRAITDINFSANHPDVLATCAVDSYVHCWDLRQSERPVMTFADWFAGATQVKWNRQDPHILASSHDRTLRIWDDRKGAYPLRSIVAHRTKIYGIDWNRTKASGVLTCSLDKTIKFWDYEKSEDIPETVIRAPFPVWRARHTPFGFAALVMPQRGDSNLHMYDLRPQETGGVQGMMKPVHSFTGHTDHVKEFLWRARGGIEDGIENRDFQLVSWGSDRHLRLHQIDPNIINEVGYKKGEEVSRKLRLSRQGAAYRTFREETNYQRGTRGGQLQGLSAMFRAAATAGMSKGPVHSNHSRGNSAHIGSSTGMQTKSGTKKPPDPIKWMEGVKIGKREGTDAFGDASRDTLMSPEQPFRWDVPESLGDEITAVGSKFKNVNFEKVDVARRTATVTLNGPWGDDSKPAFVRVHFVFPNEYPANAIPKCKLLKTTSAMADETRTKLRKEIRSIAEFSQLRQRSSLEAVLGYLLGERGLEESISMVSDERLGGQMDASHDDSSSDEEDDGIGGEFNGERAQDLEMSGTDIISATNVNANAPLPKECAAVWSHDGRLICFFPPKPEPKPIFSLAGLKAHDRLSKSQKISEGLRRLYNHSLDTRTKVSSAQDDDDRSSSDGSWLSTSSSSSSEEIGRAPGRIEPPAAWRGASLRFQRTSLQSSAGHGSRVPSVKTKSVITLHNFQGLLPAKRYLAKRYEIYGDADAVCRHNAKAAKRCGQDDLADVWEIVRMILSKEVPLEIMPQQHRKEPILVMARRALVRIKKKDSGLDLAFDEADAAAKPKLKGRVKWGEHPFARTWLITALFEHFEKLADIQMLAMLSCMFSELAAKEGVVNDMMHLRQPELPMPMKSPAFSLDYFPSQEVAWSLFRSVASDASTPVTGDSMSMRFLDQVDRRLDTYGSATSSNGPWASDSALIDPVMSYSVSTTPPALSRTNTRSTVAASYSTSPEQHHHSRRSNSNLATAFATLSRPFSGTASSSPPNDRRADDTDLSASAPSSAITWGTNTFYSSGPVASSTTPRSRHSNRQNSVIADDYDASDDDEHIARADMAKITSPSQESEGDVVIKVTLKNQDRFDDEAHGSTPLLDPALSWKYRAYRASYANLLTIWGLAIPRSEVLKFNGLASYWPDEDSKAIPRHAVMDIGRRRFPQPVNPSSRIPPTFSVSSFAASSASSARQNSQHPLPRLIVDTVFDSPPIEASEQPARRLRSWFSFGRSHQLPASISNLFSTSPTSPTPALSHSFSSDPDTEPLTPIPERASIDLMQSPPKASPLTARRRHTAAHERHERPRAPLESCAVCWEPVLSLYNFCDECQHVVHSTCFSTDPPAIELDWCEIGCGCQCGEAGAGSVERSGRASAVERGRTG